MRKISISSFAVLVIFSTPFVAAHPDTVGISINTFNEIVSEVEIINVMDENEQDSESEFLSISWFFQNFILLLTGIISVTIVAVVAVIYREEISSRKSVRITLYSESSLK